MNKNQVVETIKNLHKNEFIPLHAPYFRGNESKYVNHTIKTEIVSSIGSFVSDIEDLTSKITGTKKAVAVVNGTSALQLAQRAIGVEFGDEVLTQSLSFVATSNSIVLNGANPIFIDVDIDTMGMSPASLKNFLKRMLR